MRYMVLVKANKDSEAGALPGPELLAEMGRFNEELVKAGVMQAGEGLMASSHGFRVRYTEDKTKPVVTEGPFAETGQLVAGFWLLKVKSREEALEWVRRAPFAPGEEVEVRRVFDPEDWPAEYSEEIAREEELRQEVARQQAG